MLVVGVEVVYRYSGSLVKWLKKQCVMAGMNYARGC